MPPTPYRYINGNQELKKEGIFKNLQKINCSEFSLVSYGTGVKVSNKNLKLLGLIT